MTFSTRDDFVNAAASEKITLAHVNARSRLFTWTLDSGSIYKRVTPNFVVALKKNDTTLTEVSTLGALSAGKWYYDILNSTLYVWNDDSSDPATQEMIVTYKLFFSTVDVQESHDLEDDGDDVHYEGRILSTPGYKHKIGIDQKLVSIVGTGNLRLENSDGYMDTIFDKYVWENQTVELYSWNRQLPISEAKIFYRGRITKKDFTVNIVNFTIKDSLFDLEATVPQSIFGQGSGVRDSDADKLKRWVYGRVDGLKAQSIDQIGEGYVISGTVSFSPVDQSLTGVGTSFLSELSPGDKLIVETLEFTIDSITDNTNATLSKTPDYAVNGVTATLKPEIPTTDKNREFFIADHACAEITKTVVNALQFNRIVLNSTEGLFAGDFVEFSGTGERIEIKNIAPGNIIVLRQNVIEKPAVSSTVTRQPVQQVFVGAEAVNADDYTISNTTELTITLDADTEFNIASQENINSVELTFTNASRVVTKTSSDIDLTEIFKPRDYIRPQDLSYTTFYEILSVSFDQLELRTSFSDPTITDNPTAKFPDYIGDDTIVSVNMLGKTVDGTATGDWIRTSSEVVEDLLSEINVTNVDSDSFDDVKERETQLISYTIPKEPTSERVKVKSVIDDISRTTRTVLTLDEQHKLKYTQGTVSLPAEVRKITEGDIVNWKITSVNGKTFRTAEVRYRHRDVDRFSQQTGNNLVTHSSEFVERYIGTDRTDEIDVYLYDEFDANIFAHRHVYYNSLGRSDLELDSDLRLADIEIGDVIDLDLDRLYTRFGDDGSRQKLCSVVGKNQDGSSVKLFLSDLGNTYNTSAFITEDTHPDFSSSDSDDKIIGGYITSSVGIVDDDETTDKTNLIS